METQSVREHFQDLDHLQQNHRPWTSTNIRGTQGDSQGDSKGGSQGDSEEVFGKKIHNNETGYGLILFFIFPSCKQKKARQNNNN